jgi:hypothetical protein
VAGCVFILSGQWWVVGGALAGAAIQLGLPWLYFGNEVMLAYAGWLQGVGEINALLSVKLHQMHSLYALFKLAIPSLWIATLLYALAAAICVGAAYLVWRGPAPLPLRYSFLLVATVLASPHLYVYDLVILAPAFLIIVDHTLAGPERMFSKPIQRMLYFAYALPLAGVIAQVTHVQLSVIAMTALAITLFRAIRPQLSSGTNLVGVPQPML